MGSFNLSGTPQLFVYALTEDTGFAPCVENGLLSLACCKQPLRKFIGEKSTQNPNGNPTKWDEKSTPMFIMGVMKSDKVAKARHIDSTPPIRYHLVFLAQVTNVVTMKAYFDGIGKDRIDGIYDANLKRNGKLRKGGEGVHINQMEQKRDREGEYVLLSDRFIYLGSDALDILKIPGLQTEEATRLTQNKARQFTSIQFRGIEFAPTVLGSSTRNRKRAWAEGDDARVIIEAFIRQCERFDLADKPHAPMHANKLKRYTE